MFDGLEPTYNLQNGEIIAYSNVMKYDYILVSLNYNTDIFVSIQWRNN